MAPLFVFLVFAIFAVHSLSLSLSVAILFTMAVSSPTSTGSAPRNRERHVIDDDGALSLLETGQGVQGGGGGGSRGGSSEREGRHDDEEDGRGGGVALTSPSANRKMRSLFAGPVLTSREPFSAEDGGGRGGRAWFFF